MTGYYLYMRCDTGTLFLSSRRGKAGVYFLDECAGRRGRWFMCVGHA